MTAAKNKQLMREVFEALGRGDSRPYLDLLDDDFSTVVVEHRGCVTTKRGQLYNNEYCLVCRLDNGRLKSMKEYADSLLVDRVLDPPPWAKAEAAAG